MINFKPIEEKKYLLQKRGNPHVNGSQYLLQLPGSVLRLSNGSKHNVINAWTGLGRSSLDKQITYKHKKNISVIQTKKNSYTTDTVLGSFQYNQKRGAQAGKEILGSKMHFCSGDGCNSVTIHQCHLSQLHDHSCCFSFLFATSFVFLSIKEIKLVHFCLFRTYISIYKLLHYITSTKCDKFYSTRNLRMF